MFFTTPKELSSTVENTLPRKYRGNANATTYANAKTKHAANEVHAPTRAPHGQHAHTQLAPRPRGDTLAPTARAARTQTGDSKGRARDRKAHPPHHKRKQRSYKKRKIDGEASPRPPRRRARNPPSFTHTPASASLVLVVYNRLHPIVPTRRRQHHITRAPTAHSPALRSSDDSNDPNTESTSHSEATGRPRNTRRTSPSSNTTLDPSRATTLNATLTPPPKYSDRRTPPRNTQPAATVTAATVTTQPDIKKPRSISRITHAIRPHASILTQHAHTTIHVHHVHATVSQHGTHMRPALDAPNMSLAILIASNEAHRATVRHNAHATAARHTRRHLAATNTPNKTTFRFPHHASRVHALKPHAPRLAHRSATSHVSERHAPRILHHRQATHTHVITKRAATNKPAAPLSDTSPRYASDTNTNKQPSRT